MQKNSNPFSSKPRKKVLISNDFREVLISQDTSIIEQRVITMILSAIKEQQSLFISTKTSSCSGFQQLSFDDYFEGWANQGVVEFKISLNELNPNRKMTNLTIQKALINMTNINWFRLKDHKIDRFKAVPFILEPSWDRKHIYFNMDRAVIKNLLNMSHYFSLKKDLPYKTSSPNTLRFLMWLLKFKNQEFIVKEYSEILKELSMTKNRFENRAKFERDFLKNVKADLDSYNDMSFNYKCDKGLYNFVFYDTKNAVGKNEKFPTIEELKIERSLKYLKRKRNLSETNINVLRKLYQVKGHRELSKKLNGKIDPKLLCGEYIKAVFTLLEK